MTLSLMLYGLVLTLLLAGAAHFLDQGLRNLGRPTRWVWLGAMAGGALGPFVSRFLPPGTPPPQALGPGLPMEFLYGMGQGVQGSSLPVTQFPGPFHDPLALLWVTSSLGLVLVFLWALRRLHREIRSWERVRVGDLSVLVSGGLGPAVLGLFRPKIVLPPWALSLTEEETEIILLHEREHQEAGDPWVLAAGVLMVIVAPWNPALWWSLSRVRLAVEGDCDARVLARGVHPKTYGTLLLEMASRTRRASPFALALTEGGRTFLERRLLMIPTMFGKRRFRAAVPALFSGALFLILACETPVPPPVTDEAVSLEVSADGESPTRVLIRQAPGDAGPGKEPLVVVDGVIVSDPGFLENLDPDTIERIEVIKGEAAEALFGERAANGVIKIFLKK